MHEHTIFASNCRFWIWRDFISIGIHMMTVAERWHSMWLMFLYCYRWYYVLFALCNQANHFPFVKIPPVHYRLRGVCGVWCVSIGMAFARKTRSNKTKIVKEMVVVSKSEYCNWKRKGRGPICIFRCELLRSLYFSFSLSSTRCSAYTVNK